MGGEQAAQVLASVRRYASEKDEEAYKDRIQRNYDEAGRPAYGSARLWDDGVIDPAQTRQVLARAIQVSLNAPIPDTKFGIFRM